MMLSSFGSQLSSLRHFSTKEVFCGFSDDFPRISPDTNSYNKSIYNHLRRIYLKNQAVQEKFMKLTEDVE